MSRAQKRAIERLNASLEGSRKDADHWREKLYEEREKRIESAKNIEQRQQFEVDAINRDHRDLLANLLLLEPHLKHYQTDGTWDRERIFRAANHLRGEQSLESVGYTNAQHEADYSNVTFVDFRAPDPEGAA